MANDNNIIRVEENGIEYFTVVATGESAVSERGLAKMSGIPKTTVNRWLSNLSHEGVPKWLKPLQDFSLYLSHDVKKRGKSINPVQAKAASKFIALVAKNLKTDEAIETLDAIAEIGINSYIQGKTGWLPVQYRSSQESRDIIDFLVLNSPEKRDIHFDLNWRKEAERVTGYSWDGLPMAKFLRRAVYDFLPNPIVNRLVEVNPYFDGQRRNNKHYEHLEIGFDENILRQHIRDVYGVMRTSPSLSKFWQQMRSRFGIHIQRELDI